MSFASLSRDLNQNNKKNMKNTCPECKNEIDLSQYGDITNGMVIECNHCGITLEIKKEGEMMAFDIVDEGK